MLSVNQILKLQRQRVKDWHVEVRLTESDAPWKHIEENHYYNYSLWHEEDIARVKDIEDARIVQAKRAIDRFNQQRNNAMELIDEWVLSSVAQETGASETTKIHSETPGMMIDRLSIMALKRFHMQEEVDRPEAAPEHRRKCAAKVTVLDEQIGDLAAALERVLSELRDGTLRFKVYRQFKMYNDPSLNPELYRRPDASS